MKIRPLPWPALSLLLLCTAPPGASGQEGADTLELSRTAPEVRLEAVERHRASTRSSPFRGLEWRSVGPRFQGGRIESVAGVPGRPEVVWAGVGSGGLFRSRNGGTTWTPVFENEGTTAIGDVAVHPSDPGTVWVGTGESLLSRTSFPGLGVYRSTDGGDRWERVGLEGSHHIGRIALHPEDLDVAFVAAMGPKGSSGGQRGLYRTADGGASWSRVLFVNDSTAVADVLVDPFDPDVIYATTWERPTGEASGVHRSRDGGTTWERLGGGLPRHGEVGIVGIDAARSRDGTLYVVLDDRARAEGGEVESVMARMEAMGATTREGFLGASGGELREILEPTGVLGLFPLDGLRSRVEEGTLEPAELARCVDRYWAAGPERGEMAGARVFRSDDGGGSWRQTHADTLHHYAGHGWSFGDVVVAPDDPDEVYLLGVTLQRSSDGGRTFELNRGRVQHILPNPGRPLHLDQHDLWIDPGDGRRLLLGNDGGLYTSFDRGVSWLHHNTLPLAEFYTVAVDDQDPYRIYGGTQDNSSLRGPSDHDASFGWEDPWEYVWLDRWAGGDGFHTFPDPEDPELVYYESQYGNIVRKDMRTGAMERIRPERELCDFQPRFNWATPLHHSVHDAATLLTAANRVYRSRDRGERWEVISPDLTVDSAGAEPEGTVSALAESPVDPGLLYAGTDGGRLWRTTDAGRSWERLSLELPGRTVTSLAPSGGRAATVYAAFSGHGEDDLVARLHRSVDRGTTWEDISAGIPDAPVRVVAEDPRNPDVLYVGTDLGVYASLDGGASWTSLSAGLPDIPVWDLAVQDEAQELVIATHGRSAFALDLRPLRMLVNRVTGDDPWLVPVEAARIPERDAPADYRIETTEPARFVVYLPEDGPVVAEVREAGAAAGGEPVWRGEASGGRGFNTLTWDLVLAEPELAGSAYTRARQVAEPGPYRVRIRTPGGTLEADFTVLAPGG